MGSPCHRFTVVLTLVATLLAATLVPATAQRGHNPYPATPVAEANGPGWQVAEVTPLELDGVPVTIAPDGSAIAGIGKDGGLCTWSVPELDPTCTGSGLDIDPDSLAWAPDSSAVAFSVLAFTYVIDGDIFVLERADGAIHNVTDDGIEDANLLDSESPPTPIDVMPAWTPDSAAIVFSRTVYDDREALSNEIMRVARTGGEQETLLGLPGMPGSIFLPMRVLRDGSILYTVAFSDQSEPTNGIWRLSPSGEATQLMQGDESATFPVPVINSVWEAEGELRIAGHSPVLVAQFAMDTPFAFTWSSTTGTARVLDTSIDPGTTSVYPGTFSPDGGTLLTLERPIDRGPYVHLQGPATSTVDLPEASAVSGPGRPRYASPIWSSANLVLIPPLWTDGSYLLTMEPATASATS